MRRVSIIVLLALATFVTVANAHGRQVRFIGIHPIPKAEGGGLCNIEGPHVHIYAANKLEYRNHGGDAYFVGDPVAYKYEGPKFAYKGPHPIHVEAVVGGDPDVEYCYLEGPHFHYFKPEPAELDADFKVVGDAYFYVGEPPRVFIDARPAYVGINAQYRPLVYARPVVEVEAPAGWIGARAELVTPNVVVQTPGVVVDQRVRGRGHAEAGVGIGGIIGAGVDVHIAAPPPPSIHIGVGVGVSGGGSMQVGGGGGRHRGHR